MRFNNRAGGDAADDIALYQALRLRRILQLLADRNLITFLAPALRCSLLQL